VLRALGTALDPARSLALGTDTYACLAAIAAHHVTVSDLTVDHQTNSTWANGIALVPGGNPRTVTATNATDTINLAAHGIATGYGPVTLSTTGVVPAGLTAWTVYYWISTGVGTGKLATSEATALAGTAIDFTTDGTGVLTLNLPFTGTVSENCVVRDCEVLGFYQHEYLIWNMRAKHTKIIDNIVDGFWTAGMPGVYGQEGIEVYGGHDVQVRGNQVRRVGANGINLGAAGGLANTECVDVMVSDNVVLDCSNGVWCGNALANGGAPQNITNMVIRGNVIRNSVGNGIRIVTPAAGTTLTDVHVVDNIVDVALNPIELYGAAGDLEHRGIVVAGNVVRAASTVASGAVTCFFFPNVTVRDNVLIASSGAAMWFVSAPNLIVEGNVVDTAGRQGLAADNCADVIVRGNTVRNRGSGYPGLLFTNCTAGVVNDNVFDQATIFDQSEVIIAATCAEFEMRRNQTLYAAVGTLFVNSATYPKNRDNRSSTDVFTALQAVAGTGVHAAYAGNNATNLFPGPITQIVDVRRGEPQRRRLDHHVPVERERVIGRYGNRGLYLGHGRP